MKLFTLATLVLFFISFSCKKEELVIETKDKNLKLDNGVLHYKQKPFTGVLLTKNDTILSYLANFVEGKKHGEEKKFYYDGRVASIRYYTKGEKSGTHQAWWNDKQLKFKYHFDSVGNHHGQQLEWHSNGQLLKESNYKHGKEEGAQKLWDRNGNIKANYTVVDGDRYGLIGSKKCKPKDNELQ